MLSSVLVQAQDFQLSQFELHPLLHHPTASVLQPNPQQLRLAYRSERLPEATLRNLFLAYNHRIKDFTLGITAVQSSLGTAALENMRLAVQANYQRILNENEDALTAGVRVGMLQRRLKGGTFQFDRQYVNGQGWDGGLESGESVLQGNAMVPVLDAGLLFRKYFDRFEGNFGLSLNNINQPKSTLIDGMEMSYPMQISLFGRFSLQWNEQWRGDFYWSHNRLQNFKEMSAGFIVRHTFDDQIEMILGLGNRFGDAVIIQAGAAWSGLELALSYDFGHQLLPGAKGVLELSMTYQFKSATVVDHRHTR